MLHPSEPPTRKGLRGGPLQMTTDTMKGKMVLYIIALLKAVQSWIETILLQMVRWEEITPPFKHWAVP